MDIRSHRHMTNLLAKKLAGEMTQEELSEFREMEKAVEYCEKNGLEIEIRPKKRNRDDRNQ